MKKSLLSFICLLVSLQIFAQDTAAQAGHETTGMRANEKIYVVVAVLVTILAGLFIYIIRLDRKITRLEKSQ